MQNKKNPAWRMRLGIVVAALTVTGIFGSITPDPTPSGQSNAILLCFTISLLMSFTTMIAMIPAPSDPRRRRRRELPQQGTLAPDQVVDRYTNPSPFQPMLKESQPIDGPASDDSRGNRRLP